MSKILEAVDVQVPVRTAYDQWTQFETFPKFMDGVKSGRQLDDTTLEWVASVAGKEKTWEAKITEQEPDQRIAWTAVDGAHNAGVVTFHRLDEGETPGHPPAGRRSRGPGRERRRRARLRRAPRQGRHGAVQGVHRGARQRDRRLARWGRPDQLLTRRAIATPARPSGPPASPCPAPGGGHARRRAGPGVTSNGAPPFLCRVRHPPRRISTVAPHRSVLAMNVRGSTPNGPWEAEPDRDPRLFMVNPRLTGAPGLRSTVPVPRTPHVEQRAAARPPRDACNLPTARCDTPDSGRPRHWVRGLSDHWGSGSPPSPRPPARGDGADQMGRYADAMSVAGGPRDSRSARPPSIVLTLDGRPAGATTEQP